MQGKRGEKKKIGQANPEGKVMSPGVKEGKII